MQSPELYSIVGGNECLLHLLKFQQRTSMKWYLITSLDDTSQVLSHFVHHYLHWILFHMTVGIAGTAKKKNSFFHLLGELVVLILKPLQLLRSSLAFGDFGDRAWPDMRDPTIPTLSREAVRCFISFWMAVSRLFSSLILFAICVWLSCPTAAAQPLDQPMKSWQIFANVAPLSQVKPTNTKLLHFLQLLVLVLKAVLELHILMGHLRACRLGLQIASCSVFTAKILSGSLRSIVYRDESCVQKPHC